MQMARVRHSFPILHITSLYCFLNTTTCKKKNKQKKNYQKLPEKSSHLGYLVIILIKNVFGILIRIFTYNNKN